MDVPELTNFGSLIRYALELEAATAKFYEIAARLLPAGESVSLARELADQHARRRALLERTRQQTLNEMVLEPVSGLDGTRYVYDTAIASTSELAPKALRLEETAGRFYAESAMVAKSLLTEAARTFQKLAGENARNQARIREVLRA